MRGTDMEGKAVAARLLNDDARKSLEKLFKDMKRQVLLEVYVKQDVNAPYNDLTVRFVGELSEMTDKVLGKLYKIGEERSKQMGVTRSPTILIDPERYRIRYTGAPAGEEGRSFVQTLVHVSSDDSGLSGGSRKTLAELKVKRHAQVFVTAACPYCPGEALNANRCAIERPDLVSAEVVESAENIDLAKQYSVGSVPQTVINGKVINIGLQTEDMFVSGLMSLVQQKAPEKAAAKEEIAGEYDVIIIGAGPAGLTAGIYAARSGMQAIILEKSVPGGQVAITPLVENWPGMISVPGKQLMDLMVQHARSYAHIHDGEEVREIKVGRKIEVTTTGGKYLGSALIIATGATHKKIGVPGEDRLYGKGVSYCATCDAFFYKGRNVVVVGGGNTALTDALYLESLGAKITIVHRRDSFRAEQRLIDSAAGRKIPVIWNASVVEIKGEKNVEGVAIRDVASGKDRIVPTDAVFVAIGEIPVSEIASSIGVKTDEAGFIIVDREMRTSIPRVYAAGDITGGVRQIVTAVGMGSIAALTAFSDLSSGSWKKG